MKKNNSIIKRLLCYLNKKRRIISFFLAFLLLFNVAYPVFCYKENVVYANTLTLSPNDVSMLNSVLSGVKNLDLSQLKNASSLLAGGALASATALKTALMTNPYVAIGVLALGLFGGADYLYHNNNQCQVFMDSVYNSAAKFGSNIFEFGTQAGEYVVGLTPEFLSFFYQNYSLETVSNPKIEDCIVTAPIANFVQEYKVPVLDRDKNYWISINGISRFYIPAPAYTEVISVESVPSVTGSERGYFFKAKALDINGDVLSSATSNMINSVDSDFTVTLNIAPSRDLLTQPTAKTTVLPYPKALPSVKDKGFVMPLPVGDVVGDSVTSLPVSIPLEKSGFKPLPLDREFKVGDSVSVPNTSENTDTLNPPATSDTDTDGQGLGILSSLVSGIKKLIQDILDLLKGLVNAIKSVPELLKGIWEFIKTIPKAILDGLKALLIFLFVPDKNVLVAHAQEIEGTVANKYGDVVSSKLHQLITLDPIPFKDVVIDLSNYGAGEVVILSAQFVNDNIDYIRKATSCLMSFLLTIYVYNQIYFLIRGVYPIEKVTPTNPIGFRSNNDGKEKEK